MLTRNSGPNGTHGHQLPALAPLQQNGRHGIHRQACQAPATPPAAHGTNGTPPFRQ